MTPGDVTDAGANNQRKLRLAYLTTQYPAVSHTFIRRELLEVERRGHSVLRLAIRPSAAAPVDPRDKEELGKTIHCLSQPKWRLAAAFFRKAVTRPLGVLRALYTAVRMGARSERGVVRHLAYLVEAAYLLGVVERNDVEHVHAHFGTNSAAVARLMRRMGGPTYSITVHGPDEFDSAISFDLRGKIADCAFVAAITDFCAGQLRRWSDVRDWDRIHVVRCTVGDEFFDEPQPIPADSRTFLFIGRLSAQKGISLLIDAMAELKRAHVDARLVLAGDGELRPLLERRIKAVDVQDRVEITGFVTGEEIRRRLTEARALVLPSFAEGLPVVIMEALAAGRPVLSTYVAGIPELVRTGDNGWLVPTGNVDHLAAAMRIILETPVDRLNAMGASGRAAVRRRHNTESEVDRLESLFYAAVNGRVDASS